MDKKTSLLMAQFYEQCQAKGYTDMSDATQSLKAKVIAVDLGLDYGDIVAFYASAKVCYDEVQAEKAEAAKEAARKAVNGTLLASISDQEKNSSKETVVKVYVRPDGSIYSTVNDGEKIEGAPTVNLHKSLIITADYNAPKAIYTGATVGSVSTGGVHCTEASYTEYAKETDNGCIEIVAGATTFFVMRISAAPFIKEKFKRDSEFMHYMKNGELLCVRQDEHMSKQYADAALSPRADMMMKKHLLSLSADARRFSYRTCASITDLLRRMLNCEFPPSDEEIYASAEEVAQGGTSADLKRASEIFASISDYRDAAQRAKKTAERYEEVLQEEKEQAILAKEEEERQEKLRQEEEQRKKAEAAKAAKKGMKIFLSLAAVAAIVAVVMLKIVIPTMKYNKAVTLMDSAKYEEAVVVFESLAGYKDSTEKIKESHYANGLLLMDAGKYEAAIASFELVAGYKESNAKITESHYANGFVQIDSGNYGAAAIAFGSCGNYKDASDYAKMLWDRVAMRNRNTIDASFWHVVGVKNDGTVVAIGKNQEGECNVSGWRDIVAVSVDSECTVGLKSDGTVVATGSNSCGECNVSGWRDIVAISAGGAHTVGLKKDGTVVATGNNPDGRCDVSEWRNVVAIAAGGMSTIGVTADGKILFTGYASDKYDFSSWKDIVAVDISGRSFVGITDTGRAMALGNNVSGILDVGNWKDLIDISVSDDATIGLTADGTVVATGSDACGQCRVSDWKNIMAIAAGEHTTFGLKSNGTVVAVGSRDYGLLDAAKWTDIRLSIPIN